MLYAFELLRSQIVNNRSGLFTDGEATISGLTPGSTVWVRVRTVGLKGVMGAWSDPAKIMAV